MGAMGRWPLGSPPSVPLGFPPDIQACECGLDAPLLGYRTSLRANMHRLLEEEGVPTSDPRVLSLTAHLTRRQAAVELGEELRRRQFSEQDSRRLVADLFRGADLRYS